MPFGTAAANAQDYYGAATNSSINITNTVVWVNWNGQLYGTPGNSANVGALGAAAQGGTTVTHSGAYQTGYPVTWNSWNGSLNLSTAAATITVTDGTWVTWNTNIGTYGIAAPTYVPTPLTEEQKLERQRQADEWAAQHQREIEELNVAKAKAEKLLRENLSPAQLSELVKDNQFTLRTHQPDGSQRIYRIARGRSRNIHEVNEAGVRLRTLCAHPAEAVPDADTMLAQKLWLEADEEAFRRIANFS